MRNIKLYKTKLRTKYRTRRENMDPEKKEFLDNKILKNISILSVYKKARIVFTYYSKDIEVNTQKLIKKCWADGKTVAIPACTKETRQMDFYVIKSFDDIEKGTFGLMEPIKEKCEMVTDLSEGICIVPGFCFDNKGYRLGYGYGYYDRFLQRFHGETIGICYTDGIRSHLFHGNFDRPVDLLLTDSFIKEIKK